MGERWAVVEGPVESDDPRDPSRDAAGWLWTIELGGERRTVTILLSRTAMSSTGHPSEDLKRARRTKGRNYVETVLDRDDPPRFLTARTDRTLEGNLIEE